MVILITTGKVILNHALRDASSKIKSIVLIKILETLTVVIFHQINHKSLVDAKINISIVQLD